MRISLTRVGFVNFTGSYDPFTEKSKLVKCSKTHDWSLNLMLYLAFYVFLNL